MRSPPGANSERFFFRRFVLVLDFGLWGGFDLADGRQDAALSRRDDRTQPGVLTPGADQKSAAPKGWKTSGSAVEDGDQTSLRAQLTAAPSGRVFRWTRSWG